VQGGESHDNGRTEDRCEAAEASRLSGQDLKRLAALLSDQRLDGARLLSRLREFRSLEGTASCSAAVHLLAHVQLSEQEAELLLVDLMRHRREMEERLGRDPGLQVAAIDFLFNVRPLLRNPTIMELSQLEQTERFAISDPLTDLYNRRYFQSTLETEIRRSRRYSLELSVLMLDLDSFKSVNDVYGHPFGDLVLRRAGQVIRRSVRESDTACRFGGEEFSVVLPETGRLGALAAAERVRRGIEEDFADNPVDGRLVAMTISGGVACYPEDAEAAEPLIARSDQALYRSKTGGRNKVVIHHGEKRRAVRYPARRSATARIVARPAGAPAQALPLNLSENGALLEVGEPYRTADAVELTLEGGRAPCVLPARVVRVESPEAGASGNLVAVAFEHPLSPSALSDHVVRNRPLRALFGGRG